MALGVLWGGFVLIFTLIALGTDFGYDTMIKLSVYPWYSISFWGAVIGGVWGLIDGFVVGMLIAWLYNKFNCACNRCCDDGMCASGSCSTVKEVEGKKKAVKKGKKK